MKLTIEITQEIIEEARRARCKHAAITENCPIALALRNKTGMAFTVSCDKAFYCKGNVRETDRTIDLPPEARQFIHTFDHSLEILGPVPLHLTLEVSDALFHARPR